MTPLLEWGAVLTTLVAGLWLLKTTANHRSAPWSVCTFIFGLALTIGPGAFIFVKIIVWTQ